MRVRPVNRGEVKIPIKGTRAAIFFHLLGRESTAVELEKILGINESAIRRHLDLLERDGIISHYFDRSSVGRPKKKYRITQLGRKLLPQKTEVLVSMLTRKIESTYGREALKSLVEGISDDLAEYFLPQLARRASEDIENCLKKMINLFNKFGFFASVSKKGEQYIITYRNCVFGDLLPELGGLLCEMHRRTVAKILGVGKVELEKSMGRGDPLCSQRVIL